MVDDVDDVADVDDVDDVDDIDVDDGAAAAAAAAADNDDNDDDTEVKWWNGYNLDDEQVETTPCWVPQTYFANLNKPEIMKSSQHQS